MKIRIPSSTRLSMASCGLSSSWPFLTLLPVGSMKETLLMVLGILVWAWPTTHERCDVQVLNIQSESPAEAFITGARPCSTFHPGVKAVDEEIIEREKEENNLEKPKSPGTWLVETRESASSILSRAFSLGDSARALPITLSASPLRC